MGHDIINLAARLGPIPRGTFRVWPVVADETRSVCIAARSPVAAVLQVVGGLEETNQMDDAELPMSAGYVADDDYMTRDPRGAFQRVRVSLMGETAIMVGVLRTCATCGCGGGSACKGGCHWVAANCCSRCVTGRVA